MTFVQIRPMTVVCVVLLAAGLTGCSNARKVLGFEKQPPDEFQVVARAPLSLPPDFSLRPPAPGTPRPQEGTTRDQARSSLLGGAPAGRAVDAPGRSSGEVAVLKAAGADRAPADIRAVVNRESAAIADTEKSVTDRIIFWREPDPAGVLVDPTREAQRLRENQALGKPTGEGDTPVIKRRAKGLLEGLF